MGNGGSKYYTLVDNDKQFWESVDVPKYNEVYKSQRLNEENAGRELTKEEVESGNRFALTLPDDRLVPFKNEGYTVQNMNLGSYVSGDSFDEKKNEFIITGSFSTNYNILKVSGTPGNVAPFTTTKDVYYMNDSVIARMLEVMKKKRFYEQIAEKLINVANKNPKLKLIHNINKQHQKTLEERESFRIYDVPIGPMLTLNPTSTILNYKNIFGDYKFEMINKNDILSRVRVDIKTDNFYDNLSNTFVVRENIVSKGNDHVVAMSLPVDSAAFLTFIYQNIDTEKYITKTGSFNELLVSSVNENKNSLFITENMDSIPSEFKSILTPKPIELKTPVLSCDYDGEKYIINFDIKPMFVYWDTGKMNVELRGDYLFISYPDKHNIAINEAIENGPGFLTVNEY